MADQFSPRRAALIVDVDLERLPPWDQGPLPFRHGESVATGEVRCTYFNQRARHALYGSNRVHRWTSGEREVDPPHARFEVVGLELLRVSERPQARNTLLVVHGNPAADGMDLVESLAKLAEVGAAGSESRSWYDGLLDGFGLVEPQVRRAATIALVTPERNPLERPLSGPEYETWGTELQWLWLLASATPSREYQPPGQWAEPLLRSVVRLSSGWQALVLRDGVAFLGSGADMGAIYRLFPETEFHFRTIYLDALLLGHIQRLRLSDAADELAGLGDPVRYPERLLELEAELRAFRNVFWWQQLGPHWHGNELLRAYQRQQEIPELFEQVVGEVGEYSRQAQRALTERTTDLVEVLSIVGLPFGFAVGFMHALGVHDWRWILFSLAVAGVVTVAILATPTGQALVRPWHIVRRHGKGLEKIEREE